MSGGDASRFTVEFINSGQGPARRVWARFEPSGGFQPTQVEYTGTIFSFTEGKTTLLPGHRFKIDVRYMLPNPNPVAGRVTIHCLTRYGREVVREFEVRGAPDPIEVMPA